MLPFGTCRYGAPSVVPAASSHRAQRAGAGEDGDSLALGLLAGLAAPYREANALVDKLRRSSGTSRSQPTAACGRAVCAAPAATDSKADRNGQVALPGLQVGALARRVGAEQDAQRALAGSWLKVTLTCSRRSCRVMPVKVAMRSSVRSVSPMVKENFALCRLPKPLFYEEAMDTASVAAAGRNAARKSTTAA